jgi:hypothetical protein
VVTGALRDITVTVELVASQGDMVANRNSVRGFTREAGREMTWIEHDFCGAKDGHLAGQWSVADGLDPVEALVLWSMPRTSRTRRT